MRNDPARALFDKIRSARDYGAARLRKFAELGK